MTDRIFTDANGRKYINNEPRLHPPQRQPLTTEELSSIANQALRGHASTRDAIDWAIRHVERFTHGADPAALAIRNLLKSGVGIIPAGKEEI